MRVVIVEDNIALATAVANSLNDQGFATDVLTNGVDADTFLDTSGADVAIIDIDLPGMNGLDLLGALRRRGQTFPVLLLTIFGRTEDRIAGLDSGADDYLTKPFEMGELLARVRALARRRSISLPVVERLAGLSFNRSTRCVFDSDGILDLTRRQIGVFETLFDRVGRIVTKADLAEAVYGVGAGIQDNAVELQISRLRRKLAHTGVSIRTVRGVGYIMTGASET